VGIFQILKVKRRQKSLLRATKKPASGRATNSTHAPDAVSAEYRGKIVIRKEYFVRSIVIPREVEESLLTCRMSSNISLPINTQKPDADD
jgi:hypothetical protein